MSNDDAPTRNPKDPRVWMKNHRERSFQPFVYTYETIAKARGVAVATAHKDNSRGYFDVRDLASVARYVLRLKPEKAKR